MKSCKFNLIVEAAMLLFSWCVSFNSIAAIPDKADTTATMLDEITVKADYIRVAGSLTTVSIPGTAYAKIGSALMMLPNIPGLAQGSSGLEVVGLGKPLIILNGRELKNLTELQSIKSDDVLDVKIERSPGPQYEKGVKAVVMITTRRRLNDFLYLNISNSLSFKKKVQEMPGLTLKGKFGSFSSTLYYSFSHLDNNMGETYFRKIVRPNHNFSLNQPRQLNMVNNTHDAIWQGEWMINGSNTLSAFYSYSHSNHCDNTYGKNIFEDESITTAYDFSDKKHGVSDLHSATIVYSYQKARRKLTVTQDAAFSSVDEDYTSKEIKTEHASNDVLTGSRRNYRVYTTKADYVDMLPWNLWILAGVKFSHIDSKTSISSVNADLAGGGYSSRLDVAENNPSGYLQFQRSFGRLTVIPGIRYQYVSRHANNKENSRPESKSELHTSSFFPMLQLSYFHDRNFSAFLKYSHDMIKPSFSSMNSGTIYMDSLAYKAGNPSLQASYSENITLGANFRHFILSIRYANTRNPIETVYVARDPASNTLWQSSINLRRSELLMIGLGYSNQFRRFSFYTMGYLNLCRGRLQDGTRVPLRNRPAFTAQINLSYMLNSHFSFYGSYNLQGHNKILLISEQKSVQNFTVGVNCSLLDNKLNISVEASDIFNQAHYNNITSQYGNVIWGTRGCNDMRRISLRLSYTIFDKQIRINASSGNQQELNRIK